MPQNSIALTVSFKGLSNVLISKAKIGVAFDSKKTTPTSLTEFTAIWDTGATASVITQKVAQQCGLQPIGIVTVHTAGGTKNCNSYLVHLQLPNQVAFASLRVTEGQLVGTDILIGMDIIGAGDFSVSNFQGNTVFTYRIPSSAKIDFVSEINQANSPTVSRSAPCPCGSGKKYKRCCAKK